MNCSAHPSHTRTWTSRSRLWMATPMMFSSTPISRRNGSRETTLRMHSGDTAPFAATHSPRSRLWRSSQRLPSTAKPLCSARKSTIKCRLRLRTQKALSMHRAKAFTLLRHRSSITAVQQKRPRALLTLRSELPMPRLALEALLSTKSGVRSS